MDMRWKNLGCSADLRSTETFIYFEVYGGLMTEERTSVGENHMLDDVNEILDLIRKISIDEIEEKEKEIQGQIRKLESDIKILKVVKEVFLEEIFEVEDKPAGLDILF